MKETYYRIQFVTFSPIFIWETNAVNAAIRAKYQRLEEGLSTEIYSVHRQYGNEWVDCHMSDCIPQAQTA